MVNLSPFATASAGAATAVGGSSQSDDFFMYSNMQESCKLCSSSVEAYVQAAAAAVAETR